MKTTPDARGPAVSTLPGLAAAEAQCRRCPLYRNATQAVPGEGSPGARLMIVGEQPGDQEDVTGRPFVGPAGRVLDAGLSQVGIARSDCFVTNAVKHFKFAPRGKRRLHQKPDNSEIDICRWWLDLERTIVKPQLIVAMGVSAARGVLGRTVAIGRMRGKVMDLDGGAHGLVTVHPSYLLRVTDEAHKQSEWRAFVDDLRVAKAWLDAAA